MVKIDMEMPKSCYIPMSEYDVCPYFRLIKKNGEDYFYCNILNELIFKLELNKYGVIAPNCPIIECKGDE